MILFAGLATRVGPAGFARRQIGQCTMKGDAREMVVERRATEHELDI